MTSVLIHSMSTPRPSVSWQSCMARYVPLKSTAAPDAVPSLESLALLSLYQYAARHAEARHALDRMAADARAAHWHTRVFHCSTCNEHHIGTPEYNQDIERIAKQTGVPCERARRALRVHQYNYVDAVVSLWTG